MMEKEEWIMVLKAMNKWLIPLCLLYEDLRSTTKILAIVNDLSVFFGLLQTCRKIFENPQGAMKEILDKKKVAPKEYEPIYNTLVMLCGLKMLAERKNMSVTELVSKIIQDYVSANWEFYKAYV
jgi:hypothetical protein